MIFHRLGLFNKNQRGVTLIELIIAIAIAAIITGGITMTIFQVFTGNARSTNHMLAVKQVQNAGYWISRDAQMARLVVPAVDADGFPLNVTWSEWDTSLHEVTYTLLENGKLKRSYWVNGVGPSEMLVAQHIDSTLKGGEPQTNCEFDDGVLVLTVTATVGTEPRVQTETRVYEVVPRPD